eukprot:1374923-Rhodomonas_salina.1
MSNPELNQALIAVLGRSGGLSSSPARLSSVTRKVRRQPPSATAASITRHRGKSSAERAHRSRQRRSRRVQGHPRFAAPLAIVTRSPSLGRGEHHESRQTNLLLCAPNPGQSSLWKPPTRTLDPDFLRSHCRASGGRHGTDPTLNNDDPVLLPRSRAALRTGTEMSRDEVSGSGTEKGDQKGLRARDWLHWDVGCAQVPYLLVGRSLCEHRDDDADDDDDDGDDDGDDGDSVRSLARGQQFWGHGAKCQ